MSQITGLQFVHGKADEYTKQTNVKLCLSWNLSLTNMDNLQFEHLKWMKEAMTMVCS